MSDFSIEAFENSSQENGLRFWDAREFMHRLGYESWASFQGVITRAMGSCAKLNIDPSEVFIIDSRIEDGKPLKTFKLTRFACFLITMHGDSKKVEVMQARAALAAIADRLIEHHIQENDIGRIEAREDLKMAERLMCGVAAENGVQTQQFGIFKDAGFRGMYNMSLRELQAQKGVDRDSTLYDFMGLEELAGNLFRVTQTAAKIKAENVTGLSGLTYTAKAVGHEVRSMMIKNSGIAPEDLPIEENIVTVKNRIKATARKMKTLDKSIKKLKPPTG
jgi:DNA-damage-inducible protein D